jgi:hypothetical protein
VDCYPLLPDHRRAAVGHNLRWPVSRWKEKRYFMAPDSNGLPLGPTRGDEHHCGTARPAEIDGKPGAIAQRE